MIALHFLNRQVVMLVCAASLCPFAVGAPLMPREPVEIPGSTGGFDYIEVDSGQRRLLLNHAGNGTLDIIDLKTEKLLKQIRTGSAQGVAIDARGGRYFVAVSREKKLVIINSKTLEKTGEVPLPGPGDSLTFSPGQNRVYVAPDNAGVLWVIDPDTQKITATISVATGPEYAVCDDETNRLFQNIKSNDTLLVIDTVGNTVKRTWPTAPAGHPHGLAFDAKGRRLFIAGANGKLAVLSSTDGRVLGSVDTVTAVDQVAFDPGSQRVYCASNNGSMTVMDTSGGGVKALGDVTTAEGAKGCAVDPATHAAWVAYAEGGRSFARKFTP